ncbi:MAG: DUF6350 family protein [Candidatus Nanopelagicales bacterium]|nr:DUF6350 family protein [Candidatus Nanopelagicales bacterium]MDP4986342.1 DUF6350 family protein [Candidatus Nanopelagicales bacterium]
MTDTPVQRHSVVVAGLLVTLWTFLITFGLSVILIFTTWILAGDRTTTISEAFKVVIWGYLAMQGVPLVINSTVLSLPFLGFLLLTLLSLYRSSRWAIRSALYETVKRPTLISLLVVSVASISYCGVIAILRFFVEPQNINWVEVMLKPSIMVISMSIFAVGTVGGTWSLIFDDLDFIIQRILKLIFRYTLLTLLIGIVVILIAIGLNYENMLLVQSSLLGGVVAVIAVVVSGIGWLPNFVLWAWAWLTSSTVALGTGSSISLNSVTISQLPAWPWFALIPTSLPSWTRYLLAIPLLVGFAIALSTRNKKISLWIVSAFLTSLGVSGILSGLSYLSSGSLGSNLLINFGVSPREVFQRNMTWFLVSQFVVIIFVGLIRYNKNKRNDKEIEEETAN